MDEQQAERVAGNLISFAMEEHNSIRFGQYVMSDMDDKQFIIAHPSGECGVFDKDAFEAHIAAFFGLHF
jgi:hypothetical protein